MALRRPPARRDPGLIELIRLRSGCRIATDDVPLAEQPAGAALATGSAVGDVSAEEQELISRHLRDLGYIIE